MMETTLPALRGAVALVDAVLSTEPVTPARLEDLRALALDSTDTLQPALEAHHALALTLSADPQALREPLSLKHLAPAAPPPTKEARHEGLETEHAQ